jgi:hypothetical protein
MSSPEELARENIDALLTTSGWEVQDRKSINLDAARGVAIREALQHLQIRAARPRQPRLHLHHPAPLLHAAGVRFCFYENVCRRVGTTRGDRRRAVCVAQSVGSRRQWSVPGHDRLTLRNQ